MAPPSPRRSSRARATHPTSHQSSNSSGVSGRAERSSRALNKTSSGKSTPSASLSSEPLEDFDDTLLGRRRKRGHEDDQDKAPAVDPSEMVAASDDAGDEEDEAVRCLCGAEEYPGRPPVEGPDADFFAGIELTEDVTGFFVCCDVCKVWQHGACVGIFSAEASPDEYFCEQCRKDLHIIHIASNGQRYSKYLPLYRQSRQTSRATSVVKDRTQSPKSSKEKSARPTSSSYNKRRSTMNSRDAAYDDEQLRRAIEASKGGTEEPEDGETILRRTKRGRSDSEEGAPSIKRQRTNSQSQSPPAGEGDEPSGEQSEQENSRSSRGKARGIKHQDSRHHRSKSEKEDSDRQKQDAADNRSARANKRRPIESEPSEGAPPVAATSLTSIPKQSVEPAPVVETPPAPQIPTPGTPPTTNTVAGPSHKKGARSGHKKGKSKHGNMRSAPDPEREDSPARSMSRDIQMNIDEPAAVGTSKLVNEPKSTAKTKGGMAHKMSMLDMKRRVGAIMDFISRTQVDLAAEGSITPSSNATSGQASPQKTPSAQLNGEAEKAAEHLASIISEGEFKNMDCMQMMDVLTRDMVKWQNQFT